MRSVRSALALAVTALAATGCGDDDTKPTGPVTVTFSTPIFLVSTGSAARDTSRARINFDGGTTLFVPGDTLFDIPRGTHSYTGQLDIDYLALNRSLRIDPNATTFDLFVAQEGSCREYAYDVEFCAGRNFLSWSGYRKLACPVGDFGEFCTQLTVQDGLGATWPATVAADQRNEYIAHAKLLIAGTVGPEMTGAAGSKVAMALYRPGDYSPRTLVRAITGDSSRFQGDAWTDARHVPIYPANIATLAPDDRRRNRLGLSVRTTYKLDNTRPDVMLVRFDITNISNQESYRWVHNDEPVGGHSVTDVYLAPIVDADIGHALSGELADDNGTMFPADSLMVAYDLAFAVPTFSEAWRPKPALVGLRLIESPAGTDHKGILFNGLLNPDFATVAQEDNAYRLITAGRTTVPTFSGGTCVDRTHALVCSTEAGNEIRMGLSVGPVSLAPGASTSLTVAILIAEPSVGTFTSGTSVAPENSDLTATTTRDIYAIAGNLRTLAATLSGLTVDGTPAP
jgi:hypothetical protein